MRERGLGTPLASPTSGYAASSQASVGMATVEITRSNRRPSATKPLLHRFSVLSELLTLLGVDVVEFVINVDVNCGPVFVDNGVEPVGGIANPRRLSGGRWWERVGIKT